jgi:hypothetical protein
MTPTLEERVVADDERVGVQLHNCEVIAPDTNLFVSEIDPIGVDHVACSQKTSAARVDLDSFLFADCNPLLPFPLLCFRFAGGGYSSFSRSSGARALRD